MKKKQRADTIQAAIHIVESELRLQNRNLTTALTISFNALPPLDQQKMAENFVMHLKNELIKLKP